MAATSTSSSIRQQVSNLITSERASSHSATAPVRSLPVKDRYSRLMQAATALHRASMDSTYKLSDAQKKDCAAAAIMIAEKRGIKPSNDGKYTQDDVKNFLDPKNMITSLANYYIHDAKENSMEETDTRKAIEQDIKSVYDNNEQAAQPTIDIVKNIPSKDALLSMPEDKYKEFAMNMDPADKAEVDKERSKNENDGFGDDINPNKDVVDYRGLRDDPDWGHKKDDDDFKIEQGDIIEYLMKDVILASTAWVGNRVAGFAGTVSYELLSAGVKEIHPHGRKAKEWVTNKWDKFIAQPFNNWLNSEDEPAPKNPSPEPQSKEQVLSGLTGSYEQNIAAFNDHIKAQQLNISESHSFADKDDISLQNNNSAIAKMQLLQRRITKHLAILGEDGITFDDGTTEPYSEYCGAGIKPEDFKKDLKQLQENFDKIQVNSMIKELGYENNPEKQKEVRDWYQKYTQTVEKGVRDKNPDIALPKESKEFVQSFANAQKNAQLQLAMYPHTRVLEAQTKLFAEHYGRHKLLEELRKNPDNEIFTDTQKAAKFIAQQQQEARIIFLTAEKARREGKTELNGQPILSREGMIAEAEKLSKTSKESVEQNKTEPVKDTKLKPLINQTNITKEVEQSLYEAAARGDASEQYAAEMHNLDLAEKEKITQQESINNRRNQLTEFKKKIFQKTKGADGKGGVDIGNKYRHQGGRN